MFFAPHRVGKKILCDETVDRDRLQPRHAADRCTVILNIHSVHWLVRIRVSEVISVRFLRALIFCSATVYVSLVLYFVCDETALRRRLPCEIRCLVCYRFPEVIKLLALLSAISRCTQFWWASYVYLFAVWLMMCRFVTRRPLFSFVLESRCSVDLKLAKCHAFAFGAAKSVALIWTNVQTTLCT